MPTPEQQALENQRRKSVTDDLLNRLSSQVPGIPPIPPLPPIGANANIDYQKVIADMEEKFDTVTRQINEKFKELESNLNAQEPATPEEMKNHQQITEELQLIVDAFNKSLEEWYKKTGCVVNFSWGYNPCKKLEIAGIDFIVYRKQAPSEESIKEILARGEPT